MVNNSAAFRRSKQPHIKESVNKIKLLSERLKLIEGQPDLLGHTAILKKMIALERQYILDQRKYFTLI